MAKVYISSFKTKDIMLSIHTQSLLDKIDQFTFGLDHITQKSSQAKQAQNQKRSEKGALFLVA